MKRVFPSSNRFGFTVVELMVVIAIIGILAGLLLPALLGAITNARKTAIKLEIDSIAEAVEKYRDKYGDYPPDGTSWEVFKRHVQKAFPQILASELALLDPTIGNTAAGTVQENFQSVPGPCIRNSSDTLLSGGSIPVSDYKVMDAPEALVFFLGGFSSDPKKPFTGRGGPFVEILDGAVSYNPKRYGYNVSRENPLFEFDTGRLTLASGAAGITFSNDEERYFTASVPADTTTDLLPVYIQRYGDRDSSCPYVYFDSRTYIANKSGQPYVNFYQRTAINTVPTGTGEADVDQFGAIYPFYSDQLNTSRKGLPGIPFASTPTGSDLFNFLRYEFVNPTKFQLLGPGIDGKYGGRLVGEVRRTNAIVNLQQTMFRFPSGESINSTAQLYTSFRPAPIYNQTPQAVAPAIMSRMVDNVANFSAQTLESGAR